MPEGQTKPDKTRHKPVQKRSRERVDQIVEAAAQLMLEEGADALTTRSVSQRSGIPVPTIYRYFADRDAIIIAFIEREMQAMGAEVLSAVLALDRVSVRAVIEAFARTHMRHHQHHPKAIVVWFGGRQSQTVIDHVRAEDARIAKWLIDVFGVVGFLTPETPDYGADLMVRLFDRTFEFVFIDQRSTDEQEAIVELVTDLIASFVERFATASGLEGISQADFTTALGTLA